ncbi:MAG: DNA mismatch repair protein MutS [Alphaproteobacteria bacterium]|jgi:DNA mismatch repair protein MutS|nr:DNA mismatch repair protein MutS [Alphaproteobacteria bacterium]
MASNSNGLTPMMQQYMSIKDNHSDCLLFYRMGDFYELFFDDAKIVSETVGIALTKRGKKNGQDIPMCGIPFHAYDNYIGRIIEAGYKVAICEQTETPEEARKERGSGAVVKREVVRIITQGTLIEENLLKNDSNYLCSVYKNSVSWIDISTGEFNVKTINENLLDFLIKLNPSEIIISDSAENFKENKDVQDFFQKKVTYFPESKFSKYICEKELLKVFNISNKDSFGTMYDNEIISSGVVVQYAVLTNKNDIKNIKMLSRETEKSFVEIDAFSFSNLEIVQNINGDSGKGSNLFSVIDRTKTSNGRRMFKNWIKTPIRNIQEINNRLDSTEFFVENQSLKVALEEIIGSTPDIERSISRLAFDRGGPRDILNILLFIKKLPSLKSNYNAYISSFSKENTNITTLINNINNFDLLEEYLASAIKEDGIPLLARDGDFIKENFNLALDECINLMKDNKGIIANLQAMYSDKSKTSSLKIKFNNMLGYYIEVPSKQAQSLFDMPETFIHRQTMANAVRFTTTELAELEKNIREAESKKQGLELKIFEELKEKVLEKADEIRNCSDIISKLDIFTSMSELAIEENYCKPKMSDSTDFYIKNGRHPVVEYNIKKSAQDDFIGNDCVLNNKSKEYSKIWILTGPNMAGKSTFLRQNALITILAHVGCYVPAEIAEIGIVDKIFSRVGASDNLAKGQSTFMVEMIETSAILNKATDKSLVILDEIGRGTATYDGLSIAWAVMEYLNNKSKCRCLFATHYHELTDLSKKLELVSNHTVSIKEWEDEVIFMHKVIPGTADKSYGLHVAKIAGIPSSIINRAGDILDNLESTNSNNTVEKISNNLNLFDDYLKEEETKFEVRESKVEMMLETIDPNTLSPRDALDKLYELKDMQRIERDD